jgi:uncharacterized lipoprotein YajG
MKKVMIVFTAMIFAACGGNSSTEQTTIDSTVVSDSVVVVDSSVTATDSTTSQIPSGGGELGPRPTPVK